MRTRRERRKGVTSSVTSNLMDCVLCSFCSMNSEVTPSVNDQTLVLCNGRVCKLCEKIFQNLLSYCVQIVERVSPSICDSTSFPPCACVIEVQSALCEFSLLRVLE